MAEQKRFPVEVLTPEGEIFRGEVEMLSTRTTIGEVGVLANHAPLLATLDPAELRLHLGGGEVMRYAQAEGYLQVYRNRALVLVEECVECGRIDREARRRKLRKAEDVLERIGEQVIEKRAREARTTAERDEAERLTAEYDQAMRDKFRAETFLRLASGNGAS